MIDLDGQRQLAHRIAEHQRILKLPLFVRGVELREHLVGVVAVAVLQLDLKLFVHQLHIDAPVAAVLGDIRAVITNDVVAVDVFLRLRDAQVEIVVVEQRLAARVGRKRHERFLLIIAGIDAAALGAAGENPGAAR